MTIDFVRGLASHITAAIAVIGGGGALVVMTGTGTVAPEVGVPAIVGIISGAAGFLFGAETAKQAAKQAKSDLLADVQEQA